MPYPRVIILEHDKLKNLLQQKSDLVLEGREKSLEIEEVEKEMDEIDKEIQTIEKTVDLKDLQAKAEEITKEFNEAVSRMEGIKKEIFERMQQNVPRELTKKYEDKKKFKELKENERNKIALKVQKFKDLIIPLGQKIAMPYLQEEFEDFNDIRLENGQIVLEIFSHLEDFKARKRAVAK